MNETDFDVFNSVDSELRSHMAPSLQLMLTIEERAQAAVKKIFADIASGKKTLEEVKRERGLSA